MAPLWSRVKAQFFGLPPHLGWMLDELPHAVPWILAFQKVVVFGVIPLGFLCVAAIHLPAVPPSIAGVLGAVFVVSLLAIAGVLAAVMAAMTGMHLVRGGARSRRLFALLAASLVMVANVVWIAVEISAWFPVARMRG